MNIALHGGWYQVAFLSDITEDLTPVTLGERRLMLVRRDGALTLHDAACPHRGADLSRGGVLRGSRVICPFHARAIALDNADATWHVRSYPTLVVGPLVFGRLRDDAAGECGFAETFPLVLGERTVTPAVDRIVRVEPEYVVENAFDVEHFGPVHDVPGIREMTAERRADGRLTIGGDFVTVTDPWIDMGQAVALQQVLGRHGRRVPVRDAGFHATAFSPTVVVTAFGGGDRAPLIITTAHPGPDGCRVRVSVAGHAGDPIEHIVRGSELAIEQDARVWEHLDPTAPVRYADTDGTVIAYRDWCADFPAAAGDGGSR